MSGVPCVPVISGKRFFDASSNSDRELLGHIGYSMLPARRLLETCIIPNLESQPTWLLSPLIEFIFDQYQLAGKHDLIRSLSAIPFVRVCDKRDLSPAIRLKPSDVIDQSSEISKLYFDDEQVFGSGEYSFGRPYHQVLILLGMKSDFDADIADERIHNYYTRNENDDEMIEKYTSLLMYLNGSESKFKFRDEWLPFMRIPALKGDKRVVLHPSQCRPQLFISLVEGVLGIVPTHVESFLWTKFGWDSDIEPGIISSRIDFIVSNPSSSDVQVQQALYPVLEHLNTQVDSGAITDYVTEINSKLGSKAWLPGSIKGLWPPDRVFIKDARGFEPYMSEIPLIWSQNLEKILMMLKVARVPTANHLLDFMASVKSTEPLSYPHMNAVIIALQRLESNSETPFLKKLMIPDTSGILLSIEEFSPKSRSDGNIRLAHSRVPPGLTFKYGIPQMKDDLAYLEQSSSVKFVELFDEFGQQENTVTRNSKNKKSSMWSSLNEFVANAEDSGSAKNACWILDSEKSKFPSKKIFCKELQEWQTPALYFYYDGVFTDSDFEALINVGIESQGSSKIGTYGLGSLSLYLFTDIPSMISGEHFIIFDPTRRYLPFITGVPRRKAGVMLKLSLMKSSYPDHLAPFVGIGGYTLSMPSASLLN